MLEALSWSPRIIGAVALVGLAMGISRWQKVYLEKDMLVAIGRAFVQLIAIGYALDLIFDAEGLLWILLVIGVMVGVAGYTAGQRGKYVPQSKKVATLSVIVGTVLTLGLLIVNVVKLSLMSTSKLTKNC